MAWLSLPYGLSAVWPAVILSTRVDGDGWALLYREWANVAAGERAALLLPADRGKRAPAADAEIGRLPADRLVLHVDGLVVVGEQLDAVAVGIAQIDEARVARTEMPARSPFDARAEAVPSQKIADVHEMVDFRDRERGMVQARSGIVDEDDVVRIALALQEDRAQVVGAVVDDVFRQAEAHLHVEFQRRSHLVGKHLEMVDALRAGAVEQFEVHDPSRLGRHGRADFERRARNIDGVQAAALERHVDEARRQPARLEVRLREIEVVLGEHAHPDTLAGGRAAGLQYQAMVAAFLQAAQIERGFVLVAHHEAERLDIEGTALRQVGHSEYHVARACDGEGGSEDRFR